MSASFGVGGAVISTPAIRVLGASAFVAVGTTLPSILPSAASGTARYVREHLVAGPPQRARSISSDGVQEPVAVREQVTDLHGAWQHATDSCSARTPPL